MKKLLKQLVCAVGFIFGIYMILTSNSGYFFSADITAANISGLAICIFCGVNLSIWLHDDKNEK